MSLSQNGISVSFTRIATLYVFFLLVGGLSIYGALYFSHSVIVLLGCMAVGLAAVAGIVYSARKVLRSLRA